MANNNEISANGNSSCLTYFLTKLGMVLSRTKDTVVKDFIGDMPSYIRELDASKFDGNCTLEDVKNNYLKAEKGFTAFVDKIFYRLGYDLSHFEESKELYNLVNSIFDTSMKLAEAMNTLGGDIASDPQLNQLVKAVQEQAEKDDLSNFLMAGGEWGKLKDMGGKDPDWLDKLQAVMDLVKTLFTLMKKFRDIEWDKMEEELGDFGTYMKDTFPERFFDYILAVFLKNMRSVYADDIASVMDFIKTLHDEAISAYTQLYDDLRNAVVEELKDKLQDASDLQNQVGGELRHGLRNMSLALRTRFRVLMEDLERSGILDTYMQMSRVCERIYAVLDFCQVILEETIDLSAFVPQLPGVPSLSETKFNQLGNAQTELGNLLESVKKLDLPDVKLGKLQKQADEVVDIVNKDIDDAIDHVGSDLDDALDYANKGVTEIIGNVNNNIANVNKALQSAENAVRHNLPTITYYVIEWNRIGDIFTNPIDYFKKLYPINSYEDAEELMTKIINVARAFNSDIPDFDSIKRLLYDMLVRIENKIVTEFKDSNVPDVLKQFKNFVRDLLSMLEHITVQMLRTLRQSFKELENLGDDALDTANNIWIDFGRAVSDGINKLENEFKDGKEQICIGDITFYRGGNFATQGKLMESIFLDPLERAFKETHRKYADSLFKVPDTSKFEEIFNTTNDSTKNLLNNYKIILNEIDEYVDALLSPKTYNARFNAILVDLRTEFNRQTKNFPKFDWDNADQFNNFIGGRLKAIANGKDAFPAISSFDFGDYLDIIGKGVQTLVPTSPDIFYSRFYDATSKYLNTLLDKGGELGSLVDETKDNYRSLIEGFIRDLFTAYWVELQRELLRRFFSPYINYLQSLAKQWCFISLVPNVVEAVCIAIDELDITCHTNLDKFEGTIDNVANICESVYEETTGSALVPKTTIKISDTVRRLLELILDAKNLADEAKNIEDWRDGLRFMLHFYQAIPDEVKDYLRDIIHLPMWNFDDIHLPDYRLDTKNKFLAVNLVHFEETSVGKGHSVGGGIDMQLLAFIGPKKKKNEDAPTTYGIYIIPTLKGNLDYAQQLGDNHVLEIGATVDLNENGIDSKPNKDEKIIDSFKNGLLGMFVTGKVNEKELTVKDLEVDWLCSSDCVKARLNMLFKRGKVSGGKVVDTDPVKFFDAKYTSLTLGNYPQSLYLSYDKKFDFGIESQINDLELVLKLRESNDFMKRILKEDIVLNLEKLKLGYSLSKGFDIDGGFMAKIPFNSDLDLKFVRFNGLELQLGGASGGLKSMLNMNFTVDFNAVTITFPNMSLGFNFNLFKSNGSFGDFDFMPKFEFPTGLGIGIDISGIKGLGALNWDKEKKSFTGFLELDVFSLFGASALLTFDMQKKDGTPGFSMFGAVSVTFSPGIQLGLGFTLSRVGGSLGINRMLDSKALSDATHDGSLSSLMFIENLADNMDTMLSSLSVYYPSKDDQFFVGLMGRVDWAKIFSLDVGLFIQAPSPAEVLIIASFSMSVCEDFDKLLCINVDLFGRINVMRGIFIDACIHDSYIVGIELYGDIALRILWGGSQKGFLISAGGFHPEYTPAAGYELPSKMRRLGLKLDYGIMKMSLETYFAVTSNSIQFGADARLLIGWENKFDISGKLVFNVLFQWSPFYFSTDISVGVAVHVFGAKLCAINLAFALSGPAQWHAKGEASFWFLFVKIGVDFSLTWGKKQKDSNSNRIDVKPLFDASFDDASNAYWKTLTSDLSDNLVMLAEIASGKGIVVHPSERLTFCQENVPLNTKLDHYGEEDINDFNELSLEEITVGDTVIPKDEITPVQTLFAPNQFKNMSNDDKLHSESFINIDGGFELSGKNFNEKCATSQLVDNEYEVGVRKMNETAINNWRKYIALSNDSKKPDKPGKPGKPVKRILDHGISIRKPTWTSVFPEKEKSPSPARSSRRRNEEGFNRYVRQADEYLMRDLNKLSDQL